MYTLNLFCKEFWAPKAYIVNGARTVKSTKVQQLLDVPDRCLCDNDHILVGYKKSSGWVSLGRLGGSRMAIVHRTYRIKRWLSEEAKLALDPDNVLVDGFNESFNMIYSRNKNNWYENMGSIRFRTTEKVDLNHYYIIVKKPEKFRTKFNTTDFWEMIIFFHMDIDNGKEYMDN